MSVVRKMVAATAGAALVLAAVGCTTTNAENPPDASSPTKSATDAKDPITLRFAVFGEPETLTAYDDLARAFTKNHPNVKVVVDHAPNAQTAMTNLESGFPSGHSPDVFLVDHGELPTLTAKGYVQPVDDLLEDRHVDFGDGYQRDGLEAFSASAALQCMPHDVSPLVVYYNKDLVDLRSLVDEGDEPLTAEEGWTWEEFTRAARKASRGKVNGVHIEPALEYIAPLIWSGGGDIVDDSQEPTTLTLSEGDSRAALEQVLALVRDPQVTPTRRELERSDAVSRFKSGKLAMIVGTRALTPLLREGESASFDVMPLPSLGRFRTVAHMTGYCISSETEHVEAAADFLAFAVGREGATITATPGYVVPSNLEVAHSPAFIQPGRQPESSFVFNDGVRRADSMPFVEAWPAAERSVRPMLQRLFYAPVIDLDSLLEEIDTKSQNLLAPQESSTSE